MEIADLYPYWARERDTMFAGLGAIADRLRAQRTPEEFARVYDWIPEGGKRSINDLLRHIAYVEDYIIDKVIMDREPKTILKGSVFAAADYPTYDDCIRLLHDVHARTKICYAAVDRRPAHTGNSGLPAHHRHRTAALEHHPGRGAPSRSGLHDAPHAGDPFPERKD